MGLKKCFWTVDDLIGKAGGSKADKDKLVRKFKNILEKLGFTREMIAWFRSGQNDNVPASRTGYFIFAGNDKDDVNNKLEALFQVFAKKDPEPTYDNMHKIINILQELMPFTKNIDCLDNLPNEQMEEIRKLFSMIDMIKELKIFNNYEGSPTIKKELSKISRNLDKINETRFILMKNVQESLTMEELGDYGNRKRMIYEKVTAYFLSRMNNTFLCVRIPSNSSYRTFYGMIKNWCTLWICLFESINELRKAEEFYNICELFDYWGRDEKYREQFFNDKNVSLEREIREAYDKFQKLSVRLFAEYYLRKYKKKLRQMLRDSLIKEQLKIEHSINKDNIQDICGMFIESVGQWRGGGVGGEELISMKVEALRELDMIIESVQHEGDNSGVENIEETTEVVEEDKTERKKFVDDYYRYNNDKTIRRECLECVFDIKSGNKGLITDYLPYANELLQDFCKEDFG